MTPAEQALVDQTRAALAEALVTPCNCGTCPTDDQLRMALSLSDEDLLQTID
jgi:hypothetical protein